MNNVGLVKRVALERCRPPRPLPRSGAPPLRGVYCNAYLVLVAEERVAEVIPPGDVASLVQTV